MRPLILAAFITWGAAAPLHQSPAVPVAYHNPAWAPDSRHIAFESSRNGTFAIYVVRTDGTDLRQLTVNSANAVQPSWSPDGQRIVFVSNRDGHEQLYLMNADGSDQRRLTHADGRKDFLPSFSPDGRTIVFGAQADRNRMLYSVFVIGADGRGEQRLTGTAASSEGPRWSRDGSRILFTQTPLLERGPDETPKAFVKRREIAQTAQSIRADGSGLERAERASTDTANVSPDGRWSVVARNGDAAGIFIVDVSTGGERRIVGPS